MTNQIYKQKITLLKKWAYAYYVDDNPIATDEEYDQLYHEVLDYETAKKSNTERFMKYFYGLLDNGVFIAPSQFECCFTSIKHNDEVVEKTLNAIEEVFKTLK